MKTLDAALAGPKGPPSGFAGRCGRGRVHAGRLRRAGGCDVRARAARRQHADQPGARVRPHDSVRRQRGRADLLRGAHAARAGRRVCWRHARGCGRGAASDAAEPTRHAVHAGRLCRCVARGDAGDRVRRLDRGGTAVGHAGREPGRSRAWHRPSSIAWRRCRAAPCRPPCCCWPASRSTRFFRR